MRAITRPASAILRLAETLNAGPNSYPVASFPLRRRRRLVSRSLGWCVVPTFLSIRLHRLHFFKKEQMKVIEPVELFQKLCSSGAMQKGRLLGLDVGQRYVGLAVSDVANRIASPGSVLIRKKTNIDIMAKVFQKLVSQHSLVGFIVGYPFCLWGQSSVEAVQVRLFMEDLRSTGRLNGLTYTYWDENYTSKCVEALLEPLDLNPVKSKTIKDKFAAVGILQEGHEMKQKHTSSTTGSDSSVKAISSFLEESHKQMVCPKISMTKKRCETRKTIGVL
ncbi:Uncharacterized protein family (UPF0081) [Musa troglodytarum]|uniref:Uncharacterized protein family (UPF0081) n=1 Tax=Musa troglodytarum TaxID=320322 RepID=A0A9E7EN64_9LILI|nr:Uncharacterized protein family (UPF0081) [Musa troglodytarum]